MDSNIVFFHWNAWQELEGEADALQMGSLEPRQEAVVIAFAPPQTVSCPIETHAWNVGKMYLGVPFFFKTLSRWLHDAEGTYAQGCFAFVETQLQVVAPTDRKQHAFSFFIGFPNERTDIYLIKKGVIKQQGACLLPPGRSKHLATYFLRHCR